MAKQKQSVDFSDEDAVLAEVAKELDEDPADLTIEEDRGLTGFGEGVVYRISGGSREWCVAENVDAAHELAKAVVTQDLEEDPSIFNKEFLESHIDMDRLRRELEHDVSNSRLENLTDLAESDPDEFWREYEREDFEAPEEDEDGERPDPDSTEIEELADKKTKDDLRDPMAYLSDIYSDEEAVMQALKIAGIDIDAAAEDAVDSDGWEHFLARYDGNSTDTPSGFVFWREN